MNKICVDASLVVKWLVHEHDSDAALALLHQLHKEDTIFLAPSLLDYEVANVLRQKILRKVFNRENLFGAVDLYERLEIQLLHVTNLVSQTIELAEMLKQPAIYDMSYLLLAKQQKVDLVTADRRFYEAARPLFGFVRYFLNG